MRTNKTCPSLLSVLAPSLLLLTSFCAFTALSFSADSTVADLKSASAAAAATTTTACHPTEQQRHHDDGSDTCPCLPGNDVYPSSNKEESAPASDVSIMDAAGSSSSSSEKHAGGTTGSTSTSTSTRTSSANSLSSGAPADEPFSIPARFVIGCNGDQKEAARRSVKLLPSSVLYCL